MTLPARTSVASITYAVPSGSASSGDTYNITYNFLNNDEFVNVWYRNANGEKVELTLDSDFKIDISSGTNNVYGVCVLLKDVPDITSITFERSISISQDIDFNNSTLYPSITEYAFDKLTAISQDQNFKDYTIHAPSDEVVTDPRKFELPPESERLGKIVGFDGQGKVAMYAAPDGGTSYSPATRDELGLVIIGDKLSLDNMGLIDVPIASATTPGVVKVGTGIDLNDGTISVDLSTISLNAQTAKTNSETALSTATAAKVQADYAEDLADKTADLFDWYIDGAWENTNLSASSGIAGAYGNGKFVVAHSNSDRNDYSTAIRANEITWGAGILPASKDWKDVTLGTWLPGVTWTSATTLPSGDYFGLALENGRWVAVGLYSKAAYSTDGGVTWTAATTPPSGDYYALVAENGRWVAVGLYSKAAYSTDGGVTWTAATTPPSGDYYALAAENGRWVAVGLSSVAAYSTDGGVTWTSATTPPSGNYYSVAVENGSWVAVGLSSKAAYSTDGGVTWTSATTPPSGYYRALAAENGRLVAVGQSSVAAYSDGESCFVMVASEGDIACSFNAQTWQNVSAGSGSWKFIAYKNGIFSVIGDSHYGYCTGDSNWTVSSITWGETPLGIAVSENNFFVAFQNSTSLAKSTDGSSWTVYANTLPGNIEAFCFANGNLVALNNGTAYYSADEGSTWTTVTLPNTLSGDVSWAAVAYGGNRYVAIAKDNTVIYSSDLSTWHVSQYSLPTASGWCDLLYGKGTFLAINSSGTLCAFKPSIDIVDLLEGLLA